MDINIKFANKAQQEFYYAVERNQCFSGGFNNGKTFIGSLKSMNLLNLFTNYRMFIGRQKYTDLKKSTMQTFFKLIPSELIVSHNEQDGFTLLSNSSLIYWMHLDNVDANTARGLEVNSGLIDQAEETEEKVHDVLDARIGRWDGVIVPVPLLELHEKIFGYAWPKNQFDRYIVPSYLMLLTNPDTEFHYIYRKYHPDSTDRNPKYYYTEGEWQRDLGSEESYDQALSHDDEWVDKFVRGKWGSSSASIHTIRKESILEPTEELLHLIKTKGNLFRILDHGDSSPTCCLWCAAVGGVYIFYREYYVASKVITYHRRAINDLSGLEEYSGNYADPTIFDKRSQRQGGFWSVADEYMDSDLKAPELSWTKADNNEFATRNRINELLMPTSRYKHPVSKESPAPGIYFTRDCKEAIRQTGAQRKKLLGTVDGKSIYSDDRDENITDHAYDCVRYFVAMHGSSPRAYEKKPPRNSFAYFNSLLKRAQLPLPASVSPDKGRIILN